MKTTGNASLALGIVLGLFISGAQAETGPVRVPLTLLEAQDLGLDHRDNGFLYKVLQPENAPIIEGSPAPFFSFSPEEQRGVSSDVLLQSTDGGRWCESGSGAAFADIALNLPSGVEISVMRTWGFDQSASDDLTVSLIERCTPSNSAGGVVTSVISSLSSSGSQGNFSNSAAIGANNIIANDTCSYTLRTRYSTPGEASPCAGSNLRLQKVRLLYSVN
jgi:hypothetical protein